MKRKQLYLHLLLKLPLLASHRGFQASGDTKTYRQGPEQGCAVGTPCCEPQTAFRPYNLASAVFIEIRSSDAARNGTYSRQQQAALASMLR
jgi:hypothetical protein